MNKEAIDKNPVVKLAFEFSLEIISFCELLEDQKKYVIARQLLKSGNSIVANIIEAQNSESKVDLVHKFKLADQEAEETEYWQLCNYSKQYPDCKHLLSKAESLSLMIGKILSTSKRKNN